MNPRYLIYVCTLPLLVIACALIAAVPINRGNDIVEHICISVLLGTMYGVTTVAAAWSAFGPGWISARVPLSLVVVALLVVALGLGTVVHDYPMEITTLMGASVAAQWLVSQAPLWAMSVICGLRLRHYDEPSDERVRGQFGIRQLMIFTAIVGVLLGIGRLLVANFSFSFLGDREMPIFLFLVGAAVLMTLPLVFAAFLARYWQLATLGCLMFIVVVTLLEWPLITTTFGTSGGPDLGHLVGINSVTTFWVLAFAGMTRLCGYHFREPIAATETRKA